MSELLIERLDLVERFFVVPTLDYDKYEQLIYELNYEGESRHTDFRFNDITDSTGSFSQVERLAVLSVEQLDYLTAFINSNELFAQKLTVEETAKFFASNLDLPLQSLNNSRVAMFLFCLRDKQILVHKWQKIIQDNKLILSSATGLPLKSSNIKNALTLYRRIHGGPDFNFVQMATHLKEMIE